VARKIKTPRKQAKADCCGARSWVYRTSAKKTEIMGKKDTTTTDIEERERDKYLAPRAAE